MPVYHFAGFVQHDLNIEAPTLERAAEEFHAQMHEAVSSGGIVFEATGETTNADPDITIIVSSNQEVLNAR